MLVLLRVKNGSVLYAGELWAAIRLNGNVPKRLQNII